MLEWEEKEINEFQFFPSPAQDFITIQTAKQGQLQIFDATGRIVLERTITATQVIDLHHLPSGVYLLKLNDSTQRLLIE
ncbi:MAG: T9SS type A sorting domain-containing protein [Bacteroidota bacterium]